MIMLFHVIIFVTFSRHVIQSQEIVVIQCKGEKPDGRCFCVDENGTKLFGWSWWSMAQDMTCACSRRTNELRKRGTGTVSLHCMQNGNFEELQCNSGMCWCVDDKTGEPTCRAFPSSAVTYLPCYKKDQFGVQYLRRCESKMVARVEFLEKLKLHGRQFAYVDRVFCDDDGTFNSRSIVGTRVNCVWKDGEKLQNYGSSIENFSKMNCRCARDYRIYAQSGLNFFFSCYNDGSYDIIQHSNGEPYCIDEDGFPTSSLGVIGDAIKCG
ncbi:uncharacterized protein LOC105696232 [Orussus abietinus]|uniref:uncharacterized protein LOC105696232 n=1 Tax=Orussus abietinus TaxID=222816 RepID=UPI000625E22A|nr:uncharacterized protein LOC105696232 [Orussus abietinus]